MQHTELSNGKHLISQLEKFSQGTYKNGKPREGVVVRSQHNLLGNKPISFKIINLDYEK